MIRIRKIHFHNTKLLLVALSLMIISCQKSPEKEKKKMPLGQEQVLKINIQGDPPSLNPHLGIDFNCRSLQKALFEGLTRISPQGIPELAAAEQLEISPTKTLYTFTLRKSSWSNGENLTASHFEKAWKKAVSPVSNCLRSDLFYLIKNAKKVKEGVLPREEMGVKALDEKTLLVELEHPTPYFLDLLANPIFFPQFDEKDEPTCFNGPFVLEIWKRDSQLILKKNPLYWDEKNVHLDHIACSFIHDPNTALLMYEKGEIDWIGGPFTMLPLDAIPKLEKQGAIHSKPIASVYWLCCNTQIFPLNTLKFRKALSFSLNRKEIAKDVLYGEFATQSVLPTSLELMDDQETFQNLEGDEIEAKKLFAECLEELNLKKEDLPPLILSHSDVPGQKKLAEAIQQQWESTLGIEVELQGAEWNVFFSNLRSRQYQIGGCIWYSVFNDPIYNLEFFKDKENVYNVPQWENPRYQKLLDLSNVEPDTEMRKVYMRAAEELLLEEMPIIPLFVTNFRYLIKEEMKDIYISDLGHVDFKWAHTR